MKIVLADDSKAMRMMQRNILAPMGFEIFEAANGEEALAVLSANMPMDYVLMDWNMPVKNGYETLVEIRKSKEFRFVKVIMCSSESDTPRILEALKAGAANYIQKPFTESDLREKLGLNKSG